MQDQSLFNEVRNAQLRLYKYMVGKSSDYEGLPKDKWAVRYFSKLSNLDLDKSKTPHLAKLPEYLVTEKLLISHAMLTSAYAKQDDSRTNPRVKYSELRSASGSFVFYGLFPADKNGNADIADIREFLSSAVEGEYDSVISVTSKQAPRPITEQDVSFFGLHLDSHIGDAGVNVIVRIQDKTGGYFNDIVSGDPIL